MTTTAIRAVTRCSPVDLAAADRKAVEDLRGSIAARKSSEPPKPTAEQVARVVADITSVTPLSETVKAMALPAGVDGEKFVLDMVATFGTWLAHSTGASGLEVTYAAKQEGQMELFQPSEAGMGTVIAPLGYEPTAGHRRDLGKAIGAIASITPDSEAISRFVARTYATRPARLSYQLVVGVWGQVSRDRIGSVSTVSEDLVFQSLVVEAYDMLDVAREDGVRAVTDLLAMDGSDADAVKNAATIAYWLAEAPLRSVVRAAELAPSGEAAAARLVRELSFFRDMVRARPEQFLPAGVRDLTLGHVQRICVAAGLKIQSENRLEETEIRATLKELGLGVDADRLVPEALRLADRGLLDAFWDVMTARIEGDATWVDQLQELVDS